MDAPNPFDLGQLYRSIEAVRLERELSWSALAREVGVSASTIRRFERASDAEADGVLTLLAWLGSPPEQFFTSRASKQEGLPPLDGGMIRIDSTLIAALGTPRLGPGSRTTIQRLARIAIAHSRTVASLTRWSAC